MVASTDQPTLTPEERKLLADLCNPNADIDYAAHPDLAALLDRPEAQSHLEALTTIRDIRYTASLQQASIRAIKILEAIIEKSNDLVEHRRAAGSILRTIRSTNRNTSPRDPRNPCHRNRLCDRDASRSNRATTFRAPTGFTDSPPLPPTPEIPAHYKPLKTFVATDFPARSLKAHQAVANALGLIKERNPASLFNLSTYRGCFGIKDPDDFEKAANEKFKELFDFQAAYAAPLLQTGRQQARQDVILIPKEGDPVAFTIHLRYPVGGQREYCWLIDDFAENPLTRPTSKIENPALHPNSS